MKKFLLVSILLIFLASCHKNDNCDSNTPTLIGTWTWIKSEGGFGGGTITPAITGEKIVLSFTSDSVYREYLNNKLITESKFTVTYKKPDSIPILDYNSMIDQSYIFEDCNNLILTDLAADGYTNYYKRNH